MARAVAQYETLREQVLTGRGALAQGYGVLQQRGMLGWVLACGAAPQPAAMPVLPSPIASNPPASEHTRELTQLLATMTFRCLPEARS